MRRLEYSHDNHVDSYCVEGKRLANLQTVLIEGQEFNVDRTPVTVYYGEDEVGGPYPATSYHYFVTIHMFGIDFPIDINKLITRGVEIIAMEYSLET